jgi:hypothetical protein
MNTKILVAFIIGIALVGLTGAASADPSITFPVTADIDYSLSVGYSAEELDDGYVYSYVESDAGYYMEVDISDYWTIFDWVEKEGYVYNWAEPIYGGVSGDFAGEVQQAGAVSDALIASDVVAGAIATEQVASFEGESVGWDWPFFGTDGYTMTETPQITSGLAIDGFGEMWASSTGDLLSGEDTFATSSAYVPDILPNPTTLVTSELDMSVSTVATDDIYQDMYGYLNSWAYP